MDTTNDGVLDTRLNTGGAVPPVAPVAQQVSGGYTQPVGRQASAAEAHAFDGVSALSLRDEAVAAPQPVPLGLPADIPPVGASEVETVAVPVTTPGPAATLASVAQAAYTATALAATREHVRSVADGEPFASHS